MASAVSQDLVLETEDLVAERCHRLVEDGVLHLQHAQALLKPLLLDLLLAAGIARSHPVPLSIDPAGRRRRIDRVFCAVSLGGRSRPCRGPRHGRLGIGVRGL